MSGTRPRRNWRTGTSMARADTIDMQRPHEKPFQQPGQPSSRHSGALLALIGLGLSLAAAASRADTVVVTAERMIDVVAGKVVEHPRITIIDGRITAVASAVDSQAALPADTRRIDL